MWRQQPTSRRHSVFGSFLWRAKFELIARLCGGSAWLRDPSVSKTSGPASLPPRCASERRVCRPAHCPNLEARFPRKDRRRERRKSEHVRSVRLTLRLSPTSTCMSGSRNCAAQSSSRRAESPAQPAPTMAGRRARHRTARPQRRQVFQVWPHVNILPLMYL